jgi:hypothetical protein
MSAITADILLRAVNLLPLAIFVCFLFFVGFEVLRVIRSPDCNWRHSLKGCLEAFLFLVVAFPVVIGVSLLSGRIADRFGFDYFEETKFRRYLGVAALIPILLFWNGVAVETDRQEKAKYRRSFASLKMENRWMGAGQVETGFCRCPVPDSESQRLIRGRPVDGRYGLAIQSQIHAKLGAMMDKVIQVHSVFFPRLVRRALQCTANFSGAFIENAYKLADSSGTGV